MYLYTTVQVISHVFVCYVVSPLSLSTIFLLDFALYLYTTVQVSSHAFVYYGSSERSCMCILRFK